MRRIPVKSILSLIYLLAFGAASWQIYKYWSHKAVVEAASGKTFRMNCPKGTLLDCTFTEIPTHINRLTEVFIPTALCSFTLLIASLALLYWVIYPEAWKSPEKEYSP